MIPETPELCVNEISLIPEEKLKEITLNGRDLTVAVLKNNPDLDTRVPLTPMAVSILSAAGHHILIEAGAGIAANYTDAQYAEAGGDIVVSREKLFKSDIVIKTAPFTVEEAAMTKKQQTLISHLGVAQVDKEMVQTLLKRKVIALALEYIQTEKDFYPISHLSSEIAGRNAIFMAAEQLGKQSGGKGVLLGGVTGISPSSVVIIGTGTAARHAANAAVCLGADVKVFDDDVYKLINFRMKLGREIFTSVFLPQVLNKALASADVVIGAKHINSQPSYPIVTAEMVSKMKKGSVIIDLNVETGSCFETSRPTTLEHPVFDVNGVIHYCLPNITSLVPRTASIVLSNVLYPIINEIGTNGGINPTITFNRLLRTCVYCYNGMLTNQYLGKKLGRKVRDMDLYLL
ncbi:MAG: alanine dehydrogenase [Bacteroidales bacterium]|nr:alanine dehydrogenase [Bacteroidales bacterium]